MNERILRAITLSGLKYGQVAKACGVSGGSITQWIDGSTKNLRPENLFALADLTGFSPRWIGTGVGPERPHELPDTQLTADETALLTIYRELPQEQRELIFGIIRGMKSVAIKSPPKKPGSKGSRATG